MSLAVEELNVVVGELAAAVDGLRRHLLARLEASDADLLPVQQDPPVQGAATPERGTT